MFSIISEQQEPWPNIILSNYALSTLVLIAQDFIKNFCDVTLFMTKRLCTAFLRLAKFEKVQNIQKYTKKRIDFKLHFQM